MKSNDANRVDRRASVHEDRRLRALRDDVVSTTSRLSGDEFRELAEAPFPQLEHDEIRARLLDVSSLTDADVDSLWETLEPAELATGHLEATADRAVRAASKQLQGLPRSPESERLVDPSSEDFLRRQRPHGGVDFDFGSDR